MTPRIAPSIVACAAAVAGAQAQTIDQFDVRREGKDAVLQLRFGTEVQLQRSVSTQSGDLTLIFYSLVSTTNAELRSTQSLRLGARQGLPEMALFDEVERGDQQRKIVLRTSEAARISVRAGSGNRSIEIVVGGAGAAVTAAQTPPVRRAPTPAVAPEVAPSQATPATLPDADRRFVIVLLSSSDPNVQLPASIPRSLQSYDVFTAERVVNGSRKYEIQLGHFASRTQAEAVMRQLDAFPLATIVATTPPATTVSAAPAPIPAPAARQPASPPDVPARPPAQPVPTVPAPAIAATPPAASAASPTPPATLAAAPIVAVTPVDTAVLKPAEIEARAEALMTQARDATTRGEHPAAVELLNTLLNLPANRQTRAAQELIGQARARSGDAALARIEFETFLQLYPQGADSDRVRRELAALPAPAAASAAGSERPKAPIETTVTGSVGMSYYGGNGKVRSQEFTDSPVAGVPQVVRDPQFTDNNASQLLNDVDLTWRRRDADTDMRFVFRDSYTADFERSDKSRNRLSALYFDYKSLSGGYGGRLGRQSPTGGGVMSRYDGASGYYLVQPKIKLGAVVGMPSEKYFDSTQWFLGGSVDFDGLVPNTGVSLYSIQQMIDGYRDRRAVGLDLRYFKGGGSVFAQFDYDTLFRHLNVATVQGTLVMDDTTVYNALYDRRAVQMLTLGNALIFSDPSNPGVTFTKIADKIATTTLPLLREQIRQTTPYVTLAQFGVTRPYNKTWQYGGNLQVTNIDAIPPVPGVDEFKNGRPATGNIFSLSGQLIGSNLYSSRDTHVFVATAITSPDVDGFLLSYNLSSVLAESWQLEPSLQFYSDRSSQGTKNQRWTPGARVTYRGFQRWAIESSITYEIGKSSSVGPDPFDPTRTVTTKESSNRVNYSLGVRYEF
jgi:hypothetical protein